MRGVEDWLFRRTVLDMLKQQPELLVVEEGFDSAFGGASFDYLEYFSQDARFGEILGRYKKGPIVGHVRLYLREELGN